MQSGLVGKSVSCNADSVSGARGSWVQIGFSRSLSSCIKYLTGTRLTGFCLDHWGGNGPCYLLSVSLRAKQSQDEAKADCSGDPDCFASLAMTHVRGIAVTRAHARSELLLQLSHRYRFFSRVVPKSSCSMGHTLCQPGIFVLRPAPGMAIRLALATPSLLHGIARGLPKRIKGE